MHDIWKQRCIAISNPVCLTTPYSGTFPSRLAVFIIHKLVHCGRWDWCSVAFVQQVHRGQKLRENMKVRHLASDLVQSWSHKILELSYCLNNRTALVQCLKASIQVCSCEVWFGITNQQMLVEVISIICNIPSPFGFEIKFYIPWRICCALLFETGTM